jgi:hypothetical protein
MCIHSVFMLQESLGGYGGGAKISTKMAISRLIMGFRKKKFCQRLDRFFMGGTMAHAKWGYTGPLRPQKSYQAWAHRAGLMWGGYALGSRYFPGKFQEYGRANGVAACIKACRISHAPFNSRPKTACRKVPSVWAHLALEWRGGWGYALGSRYFPGKFQEHGRANGPSAHIRACRIRQWAAVPRHYRRQTWH